MGQQQSKRSFSVGTRLLVGVVTLIVFVIAFLNISAIFLLKEDKQAATLQSKSTEAVLGGTEFVNIIRHAHDTLNLAMASTYRSGNSIKDKASALQKVIDSQSDAALISINLFNTHTGNLVILGSAKSQNRYLELGSRSPNDFHLSPDQMLAVFPELKKNSYAFVNFTRSGGSPVIAIINADMRKAATSVEVPVGIAILPLQEFGAGLMSLNLTIATKTGWTLYSSDSSATQSQAKDPLFDYALSQSGVKQGTFEYNTNGGHFLGSFYYPGLDLVVLTKADWSLAMRSTYALTQKFVVLGVIAVFAAILFAVFFSRSLTAPINKLAAATSAVADGNFNLTLEVSGDDEIGQLTSSFNRMASKIRELFEESVEKVLLESELDIASTVQQNLLPPPIYRSEGIQVSSYYQAASRCGGDWWGLFRVGNKVVIGIADATGHGLQCALMTATARSCFSMLNRQAEENPEFAYSPNEMLAYANRAVFDSCNGKIMMTFFIGVLDFDRMVITYANAGHNFPWLFRMVSGRYVLKSLTGIGQRLGESAEAPHFEEKMLPIEKNDTLFFYTDGLMETKGPNGDMYGKKRMRNIVEGSLAGGTEKIIDTLIADFVKYNQGKFLDDDVTIAAMQLS